MKSTPTPENTPARAEGDGPEVALTVGDVAVCVETRSARIASRNIPLSRCELTLLRTFMSAPDRIFSRHELCRRVWRRRHDRSTRLVEVAISRLRRKIGAPEFIQTVREQGYALRGRRKVRCRNDNKESHDEA